MTRSSRQIPLQRLRLTANPPGRIELRHARATVEASVLRPDVLRLRAVPGRDLAGQVSWAVEPVAANEGSRAEGAASGTAVLGTGVGELRFDPVSGGWRLLDHGGLELFRCPGGSSWLRPTGGAGFRLELDPGETLFGFGETNGPFNQRGQRRELWNIDVLGHAPGIHPGLRSLYVSIPLMISLREGRAAALFWDNPARQVWDLEDTALGICEVSADLGPLDLYVFLGPTLPGILDRYTELTGRLPLPPRWALGFHQSRYGYESREQVEAVAREFRRRNIPCDALHLDIHHQRGYRVFTFGRRFPQPQAMIRDLARRGFKVISIVDPGVKEDPGFGVFRRGTMENAFVRGPDGKGDFVGEVWPGRARFPDFLRADVRTWWGREQAALQACGVAGFWNDMNEPANFARGDKTLDPGCRHETRHGPRSHAEVHNLYGLEMARASREGALREGPNERPFVLTRAGWAGIQRHAAVWTGDNSSSWEHLADSLRCLLNLGLSGVAFCGSDVGGFLGNCPPELMIRWTQLAAFTPFFRNHSNLGTRAQEPWAFGPEVERLCRRYISLRYQLLPYLYGLFVEASRTGAPVLRPLAWHFQNDPDAVACGDQFLLGPSLLVAPVLQPGATARHVYLPAGNWHDFWTGALLYGRQHIVAEAPLDHLPLFVRAGSVIPFWEGRPSVGRRAPCEVVLHVWPGAPGEWLAYEDDGRTLDYQRGGCSERHIRHEPTNRGGRLCFEAVQGRHRGGITRWRIVLRAQRRPVRARLNRRAVGVEHIPEVAINTILIGNQPDVMQLNWS
ncbi:MAG: DUF5110 domain-containing protein [Verrucomicrobiales bacterium]|nr:DUF5110 domain-containing protein [Verrucomicrobiales bacterium]MCP5527277.1 DUF5110 domain-containing protein [Verrucomicrobiales bacterium]